MNLDQLAESIPAEDTDLKDGFLQAVEAWKQNDATIDDLGRTIEKWRGNVWLKSNDDAKTFDEGWVKFQRTAIDGIGGMTVNERLYWFGLFDLWDQSNEEDRRRIMAKLKASI